MFVAAVIHNINVGWFRGEDRPLKIALAQLNPIVADLTGNVDLVRRAVQQAGDVDLVVTPELVVCGYPPKDLLLREGFVAACDRAVESLARELKDGPAVLVGHPTKRDCPGCGIANAASLLDDGRVVATVHKQLLPTYDVFDEDRYFLEGPVADPIEFRGWKLGIHVCEDAWWGEPATFYHIDEDRPDPVAELVARGADVLINLSASPFELDKPQRRRNLVERHVDRGRIPFVFVNQVGGNDDLVFDGHSFVVDSTGQLRCLLKGFDSDLAIVNLENMPAEREWNAGARAPGAVREQRLLDALVLGLRDYMLKCGFRDAVLGLSGGIDSAVAAVIAALAVGPERVHGLMMPSRYSSDHSVSDSEKLAAALGMDAVTIPIDQIHQAYELTPIVGDELAEKPAGLPDQNLQARIRGACVMLRSNHNGWIALATGNKSELAVGYCTLYGDMAGGFAVLADVLKRDVYALARHINEHVYEREVIPVNIIDKAPSAELAPNQQDSDSLPPYPVLDAILCRLIEDEDSVLDVAKDFPEETVYWVARALDRNEFKRRQMAPGIKLSPRAFGSGRRMPMAARFDPKAFPEME